MGWSPGLPALLVLGCTTALGAVVGNVVSTCGSGAAVHALLGAASSQAQQGLAMSSSLASASQRLQVHSVTVVLVALVFWAWAAAITFTAHFDLGIVSFLGALLAFGRAAHRARLPAQTQELHAQRRWSASAAAFVALNYVLGIILVEGTMRIYFCIGALWWVIAGWSGVMLLQQMEKVTPS